MEAILSKDDYKTFTEKVDVASTKCIKFHIQLNMQNSGEPTFMQYF